MSNDHWFVRELKEAGMDIPTSGAPTPDLSGLPSAAAGDAAARRYADAALADECRIVAEAPEGVRNKTLHSAAIKISTLVGAGHLDGAEALHKISEAARIAGLPLQEISRTSRNGTEYGLGYPREVKLDPEHEIRPAFTLLPGGKEGAGQGTEQADEPAESGPFAERMTQGGKFLLDLPPQLEAVWGDGESVLWAPGEALMVVGPAGVGKTTVVQQLVLARCGITSTFLGHPVTPTSSKVLYLAMDRPRQIARSMRRMVAESHRELLDERLVAWEGPLPFDVASMPSIMAHLAKEAGCDTVVVDSLKDAANGLVDSERAGTYNRARQMTLAEGIEVVEIAHQRKGSGDRAPKTLADVHGGMEITAGAGSVFLVWGEAGDTVVEFKHLKQPSEIVGPLELLHDHSEGRTTVAERATPFEVLKTGAGAKFTAAEVAQMCGDGAKPSKSEIERTRRKLEKFVKMGTVRRVDSPADPLGNRTVSSAYTYDGPAAWGTDFQVGDAG